MKAMRAMLLVACLHMLGVITTFAQTSGRVGLERAVVVRGDVISIADLLPEDTPAELRARAAGVVVGDSPAPGARRTLHKVDLENALRGAPELNAGLDIPDAIEVTHWSRPVSRAEILDAVNAAISAGQLSAEGPVTLADFGAIREIFVTEDAPRIEITRIEPGLGGGESRIRLWVPSEPRVSPFWVTVHRLLTSNPGTAKRASSQEGAAKERGVEWPASAGDAAGAGASATGSAVLIRSGQRVQLLMVSTGMRISTSATALERGRQGQQIRVRSVMGSKLLVATVVSAQVVEVRY
jgi:hypothetical protein